MSGAAKIDVLQDDRGLQTCFTGALIADGWKDDFCKTHKVETLDDFIYLMDSKTWEDSLKGLLNAVSSLKDNRIILSRFKGAYESGVTAIKQAQTVAKAEDVTDTVLPDTTLQTVSKDFQKRYGMTVDPFVEPSDMLRSRVYREFRRGTMTVLETKRVKSMMHVAVPKATENIKLSDSLQLQLQEDESLTISTVVDYYFAWRTLCNAWAWAGQFEANDPDGSKHLFLNLGESLNYADFALRMTLEFGQGSLQWLARNDLTTRTKMAALIRQGYTGHTALATALHQVHLEWRTPAMQPSGTSKHSPKRLQAVPEPAEPPAKRPRQVKSDVRKTVSMVKGGVRLCKAWNDQRGCPGQCGALHQCDIRLDSGRACQATAHNRQSHPE